jgi:hypothetical protein
LNEVTTSVRRRSGWGGLACALAIACGPAAADGSGWTLRMPASQEVSYKGMPPGEDGGQAGTMLYPAPNVVGLMAGIVAHGLIAGSMRDSAKSAAEKKADKVLDPYRASLSGFTGRDLGQTAMTGSVLDGARLLAAGEAASGKVVDTVPVFFLTQDRDALVLDNSIAISQGSGEPWRNVIRVVSQAHPADDWGSDAARVIKTESANLLAMSLDIAMEQATSPPPPGTASQYRTIRYKLGGREVFERAEILKERCGRALIRNLRGGLMSVPLSKPAQPADPACTQTADR